MRIRSNLRGTRGFVTAYNRLIRFRYMISDKAKERVRVLAFWERHGTEATTEAFGVSQRTLERWQKALTESQGKLEALNPKSTAPNRRRSRSIQPTVANQIIELRTIHPRLGKDKLHALLVQNGYVGSVSTVGRILKDLKKQGLLPNPKPLSFYAKGGGSSRWSVRVRPANG